MTDKYEGCFGGTSLDRAKERSILLGHRAAKLGRFLWTIGIMIDHAD